MVGADVTPDVTYASVVSYLIQGDQHPRYLDPQRSGHYVRVPQLERLARVHHVARLRGTPRHSSVDVASDDGVNDLRKLPSVEFRWFPALLAKIPNDLREAGQKLRSEFGWDS
jgi:hypothetical protein